jgi:hypothetical protein
VAANKKGLLPALILFFLSPLVGELLSGSAPPAEFFSPFSLLVLPALYGSGALLVRELRVRWDKGWPTVFVLGAAYAIVEEGLMVKSFFDPNWMDLGPLGSYGRWVGVNWVWSLELIIYHAVFSISIPILLVELLFPSARDTRWIGRWGLIVLSLLLLADVLLGFFLFTPYRPPTIPYLLAALAAVVLFAAARWLPTQMGATRSGDVRRPALSALIGFGATFAFFFIHWAFPEFDLPVMMTILATLTLATLVIWGVQRLSGDGAQTDRHRLALAGGAMMFLVLLAPLQELDASRADNPAGMTLVGISALVFLGWLWWRVRRATYSTTVNSSLS